MSDTPARAGLPIAFYRLLASSAATNLGDGLRLVALPWLATAVTSDPMLIAVAALVGRLPWLLFSLPAGVISDRFDRRKLLVGSDVAQALTLLAFALVILGQGQALDAAAAGHGPFTGPVALLLGLLYATALLTGLAEVLRDNTAQAFLPSIVPRTELPTANGRLWGVEMVANQFVGPPLAGFLIALSAGLPLFAGAGAYALGALLVMAIPGSFAPRQPAAGSQPAPWQEQVQEGMRYLWRDGLLRTLAVSLGVLNGASAISGAIYVLFAQEALGLDAQGFGLLMTGFAAGTVLGSLMAARIASWLPPGTLLTVSMVVMGLGQLATGLAGSAVFVWVVSLVSGLWVMVWNMITVSLRQTLIPDHLLGRVNSVYRFFGWGTISIGSLLGGVVVGLLDPMTGREWALRWAFLLAALLHVGVLVYAVPRLTTARIEAAKATAAQDADSERGPVTEPQG